MAEANLVLQFVSGGLDEPLRFLTPLGHDVGSLLQGFRAKGLLLAVDLLAGSVQMVLINARLLLEFAKLLIGFSLRTTNRRVPIL